MKCNFYATNSQSGGEGKVDTHTEIGTDIHSNLIGQTGVPMEIDTTHLIRFGFSQRIIQSEF